MEEGGVCGVGVAWRGGSGWGFCFVEVVEVRWRKEEQRDEMVVGRKARVKEEDASIPWIITERGCILLLHCLYRYRSSLLYYQPVYFYNMGI